MLCLRPQCGRFLNSDDVSYLGASGTVLGWNLFTYCENDPVNRVDPTGNLVYGIGLTFTSLIPYGGFLSVMYVWDSHNNSGFLFSTGFGIGILTLSLTISVLISWRNSIYDLVGSGYALGGSISFPPSFITLGADMIFDSRGHAGIVINVGVGASLFMFEGHAYYSIAILYPLRKKQVYSRSYIKQKTTIYLRYGYRSRYNYAGGGIRNI